MQQNELSKCKNHMSYFIERYCKLLTPNGIKNIRLLASQKKYLEHLNKCRSMTQEDIKQTLRALRDKR